MTECIAINPSPSGLQGNEIVELAVPVGYPGIKDSASSPPPPSAPNPIEDGAKSVATPPHSIAVDGDSSDNESVVVPDDDSSDGESIVVADDDSSDDESVAVPDDDSSDGESIVVADDDSSDGESIVVADDDSSEDESIVPCKPGTNTILHTFHLHH